MCWLRQSGSDTTAGPNLLAKAWLADGTESEPADWQLTWAQGGRTGFAGIKGPSEGAETDVEADYILIKAEGLPSIQVSPSAFSLVPPTGPRGVPAELGQPSAASRMTLRVRRATRTG